MSVDSIEVRAIAIIILAASSQAMAKSRGAGNSRNLVH